MGLYNYDSTEIPKSDRIPKLVENLYAKILRLSLQEQF